MKKYWWNRTTEAESSTGDPIAESSPKNSILDDLDTQSINEDLHDSILRVPEGLNQVEFDSDTDSGIESVKLDPVTDERGRKLQVSELTRTRSITPFNIRDNISHLLGWDQEYSDREWDDQINKLIITEKHLINISDNKVGYCKPSSRSAIIKDEQNSALVFEKAYMKKIFNDFPLYYPWAVYEKDKSLECDTVLQTFIDYQIIFKRLKRNNSKDKIMIFRSGIVPKRTDEFNIKSCTIDMKITDKMIEFETFKKITKLLIDDTFFGPEVQIAPVGLIFKKKYLYSVISIWLHPPRDRFDDDNIFNPNLLMNFMLCIRNSLPHHLHSVLDTSVVIENETLAMTSLY